MPPPSAALSIWKKYHDMKNCGPALPEEALKNDRQNWCDNLARRMRNKIPDFPGLTQGERQ
tara:strand:- start:208 stop:390 length:183 start_codon:yes stop_codon:yes gene_type:complete